MHKCNNKDLRMGKNSDIKTGRHQVTTLTPLGRE